MLLKYLDIQGFKSFPDKTRVAFGDGLTGVVGPNGSGKSNISDAVRWVLGEQSSKTLRGEKMEDVIFSGTKTRKPQGFAEVSLTFDNIDRTFPLDLDEVIVTRRYDRSGESEYQINQSPVRLKDVQELFLDTGLGKDGYSLIGQGKIAEIIRSKSGERREIFEEAAGIAKLRSHKEESERSLSKAEDNLVRLRDIMSELEGRVAPLKEQSEKAKRFLELSARKKNLEVSFWVHTLDQSNQTLKDETDRILITQQQYDAAEEKINGVEQEIQKTFDEMQQKLVLTDNIRRKKGEIETLNAELASKIAVWENDISHQQQDISRIQAEIEGYIKHSDFSIQEMEKKSQEIENLDGQLSDFQDTIQKRQEELQQKLLKSEGMTQQEKTLSDALNALLLEESNIKLTVSAFTQNAEELRQSITQNQEAKDHKSQELAEYQKELDEILDGIRTFDEKAEGLKNSEQGYRMKCDSRRQKLEDSKKDFEKTDLKIKEYRQKAGLLQNMEQSMEGYAYSVRELMKRAKDGALTGILGTVSQLIDVKDEYATAIETAIGGALQNIVVENEGNAKAAIRLLKRDNLGRATFLPFTSVKGNALQTDGLERYGGYINLAVNLVDFDPKYRGVMNSLLGRIVVVDDIDSAVLIAQKYSYKFKIVTLDGQVVNAGGSMTGGSKAKSQGFLSRKNEIQKLMSGISEMESGWKQKQEEILKTQAELARMEAEYTAIQAEITSVNEDKIRALGEKKRLEQLIEQSKQLFTAMESKLSERRKKAEDLKKAADEGQKRLGQLTEKRSGLDRQLASMQESKQAFSAEKEKLSDDVNVLKMQELTLQKDMETAKASLAELNQRQDTVEETIQQKKNEQSEYEKRIQEIKNDIVLAQEEIENKKQELIECDRSIEQSLKERQDLEGKATLLRRDSKAGQEDKEKLSALLAHLNEKKTQLQNEYDDLIRQLWDEYELTKSEAVELAEPLDDPGKASTELISLKNRIRAIGNVNVTAIDEYKEVSQRYEHLSAQIRDAEESKRELIGLIGELTEKMQAIFKENFDKINQQFQIIFVELFGGGRAELRLLEPDNLLESGIDIIVEPPGKIINNLVSLSGGEQALVAIAIFFAILKVHPAPFCILDEIEAALDDVNVDKFASYLRNMCDKTQFIAITHRRGTMEAADVLYGVTMQEEGVSKLLRLNVSEIDEKLQSSVNK